MILLCGVPFDFRLGYGRSVPQGTPIISVNRNSKDLTKNRKPTLAIKADPGDIIIRLAKMMEEKGCVMNLQKWHSVLREREEKRDREIGEKSAAKCTSEDVRFLNPLHLLSRLEENMSRERAVMVADGGDFVATASYIVRPRGVLG